MMLLIKTVWEVIKKFVSNLAHWRSHGNRFMKDYGYYVHRYLAQFLFARDVNTCTMKCMDRLCAGTVSV